jgi:hypothetical protein
MITSFVMAIAAILAKMGRRAKPAGAHDALEKTDRCGVEEGTLYLRKHPSGLVFHPCALKKVWVQ